MSNSIYKQYITYNLRNPLPRHPVPPIVREWWRRDVRRLTSKRPIFPPSYSPKAGRPSWSHSHLGSKTTLDGFTEGWYVRNLKIAKDLEIEDLFYRKVMKLTASLHLNMDGWKITFLLGWAYFQGLYWFLGEYIIWCKCLWRHSKPCV